MIIKKESALFKPQRMKKSITKNKEKKCVYKLMTE